jgi:hypothetical protein
VPTPKRHHIHQPGNAFYKSQDKAPKAINKAGHHRFEQRMQELRRQPPPDIITFQTTRRELVRLSGLFYKTPDVRKLNAALTRLTGAIKIQGSPELSAVPVLQDILFESSRATLTLTVNSGI